jgi:hypothetical protein
MGRVRVVYFHVRSSEGGSPRPYRLRTDCQGLVNKMDYLLMHTGLWELSSFDSRRVVQYLTSLHIRTMG